MYGLRNKLVCLFKLVCLSKPVKGTEQMTLAYHEICQFYVNYESVKLYSTGPCSYVLRQSVIILNVVGPNAKTSIPDQPDHRG